MSNSHRNERGPASDAVSSSQYIHRLTMAAIFAHLCQVVDLPSSMYEDVVFYGQELTVNSI